MRYFKQMEGVSFVQLNNIGLLIFRVVAESRISSKSAKSRKIRLKSCQLHVGTTYLKVISTVRAAFLL